MSVIQPPEIKASGDIVISLTNGAALIPYSTIPDGFLFLQPCYDGGTQNASDVVVNVQKTTTSHVVYVRVNGQIPANNETKRFYYMVI